jgi:tetratricopeptide (TPR) repeat protein
VPAIYAALTLATLLVFGQAVRFGFITFDDSQFVQHVPGFDLGFTWRGVVWAFSTNFTHWSDEAEYWMPLTLLSRLADYRIFGTWAGGYHLSSVLLHLATGLVLFAALRRLTGTLWRSALVAALFLLHPMHVEPVMWLAARKDLVNALFYVLTLWAYGWYVARPGWRRYLLVLAAVLASNMGKPMGVSLPCVLLLLDFWPLQRWPGKDGDWVRHGLRLIVEKVPLILLTIGVALLAYFAQKELGAVDADEALPLSWRLGNAALCLGIYVVKMFVPVNLIFFYVHPGPNLNVPLAIFGGVGGVLLVALAFWQWRRRPWITMGIFWFFIVIGPVLEIIKLGDQAMADRYTYLSFIGLFIAVVWQGEEWLRGLSAERGKVVGWLLGAGAVAACMGVSFFQVQTWRSSETVYRHALAVNAANYVAQYNLGSVLWDGGRREEAMLHFQEAIRLREPNLRYQLAAAKAAAENGAYPEAILRMSRVLMLMPWRADLHHELGTWLAFHHEPGKALTEFDTALKYRPDWIQPRISIAAVLLSEGQAPKAENILRDVLIREPGNADAQAMLEVVRKSQAPR